MNDHTLTSLVSSVQKKGNNTDKWNCNCSSNQHTSPLYYEMRTKEWINVVCETNITDYWFTKTWNCHIPWCSATDPLWSAAHEPWFHSQMAALPRIDKNSDYRAREKRAWATQGQNIKVIGSQVRLTWEMGSHLITVLLNCFIV